jgi:hypothetical protein
MSGHGAHLFVKDLGYNSEISLLQKREEKYKLRFLHSFRFE